MNLWTPSLSPDILKALRDERARLQRALEAIEEVLEIYVFPNTPATTISPAPGPAPIPSLATEPTENATVSSSPATERERAGQQTKKKRQKLPCPYPGCKEELYERGMPSHQAAHRRGDRGKEADKVEPRKKSIIPQSNPPVDIITTTCPACDYPTNTNPCKHCKKKIPASMIGKV